MWVTHHSLFTRIASVDAGLLWCNLALLLAASVLPFPTAELPFAMQHGSHGGTIRALLLYAVGFQPAVSPGALKEMGQQIRQWRICTRTRHDLNELARAINPIVAGWMNYYGRFYRSQMHPLLPCINTYLMRWAGKKYKRLRSCKRFKAWWLGGHRSRPQAVRPLGLDARVRQGLRVSWQDCDEKSGVTGDHHAPFCGSLRFPRAARPGIRRRRAWRGAGCGTTRGSSAAAPGPARTCAEWRVSAQQ